MLLLTIINNSHRDYVVNQVQGIFDYLKKKGLVLNIKVEQGGEDEFIEIYAEKDECTEEDNKWFNYCISNILYRVVIDEFISKRLSKYLGETYTFLNYKDISVVKEMVEKALKEEMPIDDAAIFCMNKKNNVLKKIIVCLEENNEINVKGFLNFRAKEFMVDVYGMIEKTIEKYMVEKEYNEFISLLKYFVEVQESKLDRVDIFIGRDLGEYILKDEFGNDMMRTLLSELCENKSIIEVSKDDLVISGLITTCPKKIVIHSANRFKNKELLNTIQSVFENRVEYCEGCNECSVLKENIKITVDNKVNL
ncbi:MAG: putative sporulation protein YtxC [Bacilli bacterium]|uniref:putative sporulation protein YtxC n=1 Tax=Clostridium sp. TaxID=1506 RepID=UPI00304EDFE4